LHPIAATLAVEKRDAQALQTSTRARARGSIRAIVAPADNRVAALAHGETR